MKFEVVSKVVTEYNYIIEADSLEEAEVASQYLNGEDDVSDCYIEDVRISVRSESSDFNYKVTPNNNLDSTDKFAIINISSEDKVATF